MPGVPRSRGCATCRTRKLKCDEHRPSCIKCLDGKFVCPGYPTRIKFLDDGAKLRKKLGNTIERQSTPRVGCKAATADLLTSKEIQKRHGVRYSHASVSNLDVKRHIMPRISMQRVPLSAVEILRYQFSGTFKSSLPRGKSLAGFGAFITDVPRRAGLHKACDSAMRAISLAHTALLKADRESLLQSRAIYGKALGELQQSFEWIDGCSSTETLCASVLLGIYELLVCTNRTASMRHIGGASQLIQRCGPRLLDEPFARTMLTSMKGIIVIEAIQSKRKCFLDSPSWIQAFSRTEKISHTPFNTLFSLLVKVPNILVSLGTVRNRTARTGNEDRVLLHEFKMLHRKLLAWRHDPISKNLFETISLPSRATPSNIKIVYTSLMAAGLLCTYAAMKILLNCVIIQLCGPDAMKFQIENEGMADQICQSYEYSVAYAPLGNKYMDFALRVAYHVLVDESKREWTLQAINEVIDPLRTNDDVKVTGKDIEESFDYLKYSY